MHGSHSCVTIDFRPLIGRSVYKHLRKIFEKHLKVFGQKYFFFMYRACNSVLACALVFFGVQVRSADRTLVSSVGGAGRRGAGPDPEGPPGETTRVLVKG